MKGKRTKLNKKDIIDLIYYRMDILDTTDEPYSNEDLLKDLMEICKK